MGNNETYELEMPEKKVKQYHLKIILLVILAGLAVLLVIFWAGYSKASDKYEAKISELRNEVKELKNRAAVYDQQKKEVSIRVINSQIHDIGELATLEYFYTDAGKFEDPVQMFGVNIPFTTKSFIAKWDGIIKAGVDIQQVQAEVNDKDKEIIVHIPKAEILSHEIDETSVETLDQKNGLFNSVNVEDVRAFDAISKELMEERAIENGILDKAFENAKNIIRQLVETDVVQELEYTVRFEVIE